MMAKQHFGCVGITDKKGALTGIITHGDLARAMGNDLLGRALSTVMTRNPKIVTPDQLAAEALSLMNDKKITQLFVLDAKDAGRRPVGILHIHDCLRAGLQ
jgi:arabinose-5-phosphate isomerase